MSNNTEEYFDELLEKLEQASAICNALKEEIGGKPATLEKIRDKLFDFMDGYIDDKTVAMIDGLFDILNEALEE